MGLVLAFAAAAPRPSSRQPAKRREAADSADILLFTGVRYERHGAEAPQPKRLADRSSLTPPVQ